MSLLRRLDLGLLEFRLRTPTLSSLSSTLNPKPYTREHGKGVSLVYLFSNDRFLASDRAVVMGLLEQVQKCYTRLHK